MSSRPSFLSYSMSINTYTIILRRYILCIRRNFLLVPSPFSPLPTMMMTPSRHTKLGAVISLSLTFISSSAFLSLPDISRPSSITSTLRLTPSTSPLSNEHSDDLPSIIKSPVLAKAYPAMLKHKSNHGNPNIPLGSEDGKRCKTLRRLAFQNKLTADEVELLTDLGFRWSSFEDV